MNLAPPLPRIVTLFDQEGRHPYYAEAVHHILSRLVPPNFWEGEEVRFRFHQMLPLICWTPLTTPPFHLSFFLCCRFRENSFRYFCEMIRRWLIPGKQSNILLQFAVDFMMPQLSSEWYTAGHVTLHVELAKDLKSIEQHLPAIERELRLGIPSLHHAMRILESKGLSSDEKTLLVQENIALLVKQRPQNFDYDIVSMMQRFLVLCTEEFKAARKPHHMSRIICVHYLFQKALKLSWESFPERRYISVKLMRTQLHQKKQVLGIAIGISFLHDHEIFELRHIFSAIQAILPGAQKVEGSFLSHSMYDPTYLLYLEIEQEGGISLEEARLLKKELPLELKNRIERRLSPIFMPQNEEEVMRHIVTLSHQLKYVRDLPQVIIDFTQQIDERLEFLVVALRVKTAQTLCIDTCFERKPSSLHYQLDRRKIVGSIRNKYKKEATVFRVTLAKHPFLRQDHSVDLNKARQEVAVELSRIIGEFRDYNGGTLSKETELLNTLREQLGPVAESNTFLLENFFYSLQPAVMRSILPADALKTLFTMILQTESDGLSAEESFQMHMQQDAAHFYLLVTATDLSFQQPLQASLEPLDTQPLATCFLQSTALPCFGVICHNYDENEVRQLRFKVEETMAQWAKKISTLAL